MKIRRSLQWLFVCLALTGSIAAQVALPNDPAMGNISGTVMDSESDVVPGATVVLDGPAAQPSRTTVADDNGGFHFDAVTPGTPYHVTIHADGFVQWTSPEMTLQPGQFLFVSNVKLVFSAAATSVTVYASRDQIATEQVKLEEQQRVLGVIPNFYVAYDSNAAPMTAKLKFSLALRAERDPVTLLGVAMVAGMDQAGNTPAYQQGAAGYGQRLGANYATGFTDIMIGGAILPSVLHQDPRYFYQGTGTTRSRLLHALSSPFICRGDNGKPEPNFSSVGGDLAAGAIANSYYPQSDRGPGLVFGSAAIVTGGRMANAVVQEFVLRNLTPGARNRGR
ncbi:MAG TPA: carboxypeptidase-like regulatory domain-containing protein [Acidobacteriaceae bacterium]|nr:carboxypeptidase-like regulatory domain-containing protein [Acidobacteriaceae bacterium]